MGDRIEMNLVRASNNDANLIFEMQIKAFMPLLDKYKDYETNPANEPIERIINRINNAHGSFYMIMVDKRCVGAINVYWKEDKEYWISPIFIIPSYQGKGLAQRAITLVEKLFPQAKTWELASIAEEKRNCYLYEKMGYIKTTVSKKLNNHATLVVYKKDMEVD